MADTGFLTRIQRQVEEEIANSDEILLAQHQARSLPRRLAENFCYLFQPML
ncbi:MAG: hypothetical protein GTN88_12975 [Gammaproteobacteria bacterium]|nr:hypothetical protein [Gammaproteobacteria bacterium]